MSKTDTKFIWSNVGHGVPNAEELRWIPINIEKFHCLANFESIFWNIYTIPDIEFHIFYRYDPNLDPIEDILSNFIAETH